MRIRISEITGAAKGMGTVAFDLARVSTMGTRILLREARQTWQGNTVNELRDDIDAILAEIDEETATTDRLAKLYKDYVKHELEVCRDGITAAQRSLKDRIDSPPFVQRRLEAMPEACVRHGADVVARGMMPVPEVRFRTTTEDLANFMVMAAETLPEAGLHQLNLEKDQMNVLEHAVYGQYDNWRPLAPDQI